MISEIIFLLLIVGVLVGILLSVYFQDTDSPAARSEHASRSVHEANYLRYLSHVPDPAGGGDGGMSGDDPGTPRDPAGRARQPQVFRHRSWSGRSDGPASVLVPAGEASGRTPIEADPSLEVVVVDPATGEAPLTVPPADAAAAASAGSRVIGAQGTPDDLPEAGTPGRPAPASATLVLIGSREGEPAAEALSATRLADGTEAGIRRGGRMRRVEFVPRGPDMWTQWPDENRRNIAGVVGVAALGQALDLLQKSDAYSVGDDLVRKGIEIAFGDPGEFQGGEHHAAEFVYPEADPPRAPKPPPVLRLNPRFKDEDPRVLAAVLAHEGAHFQQYLDGTLWRGRVRDVELEARTWVSGAVVWQQMRRTALPLRTPLVRDLEVGYQVARQGEGLLRDFVAALYADE
jgi:hypothetical protein